MNARSGLLLAGATGALLVGAHPFWSAARAADIPLKAEPAPVAEPWWFHGVLEAGGRAFLNDPQSGGIKSQGGSSLAKYYEYSTIKPGPFGDAFLAVGSGDGLYEGAFWAKNIGYSDQKYELDLSKAGEHYLNLGWDQIPHVYSDSAQTLYNGVGTNQLTLPPGLSNQLFGAAGCVLSPVTHLPAAGSCANPITTPHAAAVQAILNNNLKTTDLGIRRDTASVEYRYTPTDAWDIRTNYTNTKRTGTQVDGVVFSSSTSGVNVQAPKPVADTTQNYGVSGEYAGTSFWDQKFNLKVAYMGSNYKDDSNFYTLENPFCPTGALGDQCARFNATNGGSSPIALMSLWPNNEANGVTTTLGMDLPFKSRYMGTASYTMMRQNDQFLPFTITGAFANNGFASTPLGWAGKPGVAANSLAALPAQSLNGSINTLLLNNVVTTQITPTLKSKLSYRYYDYDNGTPEIRFADWVQSDVTAASAQGGHAPVSSLSMSYIKQNGVAELNWRPTREWNLGAGYGFERYDWSRADVDVTNEHSAKFFTDWKPTDWFTARGSVSYSMRRYDNYNYLQFVGSTQWSTPANGQYAAAYRQFYLDNRDRTNAKLYTDIALSPNVTFTPTIGYRGDWYHIDPATEEGVQKNNAFSGGAEIAYAMNPDTTFLISYMYERSKQTMSTDGNENPPFNPANMYTTTVDDTVNTLMVAVTHAVIPGKFDVKASYTVADARDHQPLFNGTGTALAPAIQFPDVTTLFQRLDLTGIYTFDEDFVRRLGWKGTVKAKLRYAWERNGVSNWQNDEMTPYMFSTAAGFTGNGYMTWMAFNNPNYNVHMISAAVAVAW
jgi:Putative outer membrane beta-barrel porin, MtrB/PioB